MGTLPFRSPIDRYLQFILDRGYELCLIGGGARAMHDHQSLPVDLDFEIRFGELLEGSDWEEQLEKLFAAFSKEFSLAYQKLKYGVYRIHCDEYTLEFASPRVEQFIEGAKCHSNFDAQLSSHLDDHLAFRRRDFTFNAFAFSFSSKHQAKLLDPFGGVDDWMKKIIRPCGDNFERDPVRFLRMLRFTLSHSLDASAELERKIGAFDLQSLSAHYFLSESGKVNFGRFFGLCRKMVLHYQLSVPQYLQLLFKEQYAQVLGTVDTLKQGLFELARLGLIAETDYQQLVSYLALGKKKYKKIWMVAQQVYLGQMDLAAAKVLLENME